MASMFRKVEADIYILVDGDDTYPAESVQRLLTECNRMVGADEQDAQLSRSFQK